MDTVNILAEITETAIIYSQDISWRSTFPDSLGRHYQMILLPRVGCLSWVAPSLSSLPKPMRISASMQIKIQAVWSRINGKARPDHPAEFGALRENCDPS